MPIERTVSTIDVALSAWLAPAWHKTWVLPGNRKSLQTGCFCSVWHQTSRPARRCLYMRHQRLNTKFIGINSSTNNRWQMHYFTTHEWMRSVTSVSLSACVCPVRALTFESLDPETRSASWFLYGLPIAFRRIFGRLNNSRRIWFAASTFRPIFGWISATQAVHFSCQGCSNRILLD